MFVSLFRRRLIFILFLAFFLTIAPLLILYASGYRFDWTHRTIYKTGLLIVEYTPRDASFSLDGVVMDTHSPMRLSGLAPRSYLLRITKDGYIPWEKRLWVPEYITTFVRHVSLFRAAAPTNLEATVALSAPHPREPLIAASVRTTAGERAALITKDAMTPIAVVPTFSRIRRLAWSAHGKYLLVLGDLGGNRVGSIVTMQPTPTAFPLTTIVRNPLSSLTWDTSDDDQLIGYGN
ncbi:hypothetical protein HY629_01725, partial [Candidatus Uhrbacteria bacterium]|nr:hypothetical protein [Candidatus Uhrbacteria bacterium]